MVNRSQVTVRAASSEDFDFLYDLQRAAMQDYVAQTWGWDEAWQRNYFRQRFNPEECKIIMLGPENVGVVSVLHRETEWLLNNIEVLPRSQNQGIGTTV